MAKPYSPTTSRNRIQPLLARPQARRRANPPRASRSRPTAAPSPSFFFVPKTRHPPGRCSPRIWASAAA